MTQFETESLPMTHLPTDEMNHWVTKSSGRLTTAFDTVHWTSQHFKLQAPPNSKHILQRDLYLAHVSARGIDPAKGLGSEA